MVVTDNVQQVTPLGFTYPTPQKITQSIAEVIALDKNYWFPLFLDLSCFLRVQIAVWFKHKYFNKLLVP